MYQIINAHEFSKGIEAAARYIHGKWGRESNFPFYLDAVVHSSADATSLPVFYLLLDGDEIAGCSALIANDFISRHDLQPWFACLFVEEKYRGKRLASLMMDRAEKDAARIGFGEMYLTTDHDGYYEKFGWIRMEDGFDPSGERSRIYRRQVGK